MITSSSSNNQIHDIFLWLPIFHPIMLHTIFRFLVKKFETVAFNLNTKENYCEKKTFHSFIRLLFFIVNQFFGKKTNSSIWNSVCLEERGNPKIIINNNNLSSLFNSFHWFCFWILSMIRMNFFFDSLFAQNLSFSNHYFFIIFFSYSLHPLINSKQFFFLVTKEVYEKFLFFVSTLRSVCSLCLFAVCAVMYFFFCFTERR